MRAADLPREGTGRFVGPIQVAFEGVRLTHDDRLYHPMYHLGKGNFHPMNQPSPAIRHRQGAAE